MNNSSSVLEELYKKYRKNIFSYFFSKTYNTHISDELTQEVFLKALPTYKFKASFKNWLYVIAKNVYINWSKKESKYDNVPIDNELSNTLVSLNGNPEEVVDIKEKEELYEHILLKLKDEYRTIIVLRDFKGLSYEEISILLKWNLSKVKVTLYRARIKFRMYLKKEGDSL
ncbi:RNA polymerase sigma factor YlaC [Clostridium botulinum C str. Eklund]|nr:RNA polymerase sigma factor YlaC [Clostridium botulinum C str. Eklund]NEZ49203.1 RNA polymerase sigma factor [Clostridium botulinum]